MPHIIEWGTDAHEQEYKKINTFLFPKYYPDYIDNEIYQLSLLLQFVQTLYHHLILKSTADVRLL